MRLLFKHTIVAALAVTFIGFTLNMSAQTPRKSPKPLATPVPVLTGAEIISRADEQNEVPVVTQPATKGQKAAAPTTTNAAKRKELNDRVKKLEAAQKPDPEEKQKRLLLNLDILSRAEQRAESLRKQMFEMIDKENTIKARLEQIDNDIRPEVIERQLQLAGSMKPEEVREARKRSLTAERNNLQSLLTEIQATRANLSANVQKADEMVEKLRAKLEKDIDDALVDDHPEN